MTLAANQLTVRANNASLSQILRQVASTSGMKLNGLGGDERVFGSFGPGRPREVLDALLNGTSYNVVMVGNLPNGAPRELLLTSRGAPGTGADVAGSLSLPPGSGTGAAPAGMFPGASSGRDSGPPPGAAQPQDDTAPAQDDSMPAGGGDDSSGDEAAPPMQYTPPSIAPADQGTQNQGAQNQGAQNPGMVPGAPPQ